jgi:hypothetical protein
MKKWSLILNLLIPANYIWISELIFTDEEKGRFFPYTVTLLIFTLHVASIFAYSKLQKKGMKWSFLNFILIMIALGVNIFIFEQFLYEK